VTAKAKENNINKEGPEKKFPPKFISHSHRFPPQFILDSDRGRDMTEGDRQRQAGMMGQERLNQ